MCFTSRAYALPRYSQEMIISDSREIDGDKTSYAWHRLRLFCNPEFTCERLMRLHSLKENHRKNAMAQAMQIRFCLLQSQEYFSSAAVATLATRPLLLYYAAMSLALAEVLVKGTGDIRLPKLREHHAAHGLSLVLDGEVERRTPTQDVIRRLRAVPQIRGVGVPYGTFEVWKKLVREPPIAVRFTEVSGSSSLVSLKPLFVAKDTEPPFSAAGYTLSDAIRGLPQLRQILVLLGVPLGCAMATLSVSLNSVGQGHFQIIVQPGPQGLLDDLYGRMIFEPHTVNTMEIQDFSAGIGLKFPMANGMVGTSMVVPPAIKVSPDTIHFITHGWSLGEFGSFYVALHIAGNLVRYYPDIWMPHVEHSTALSLLIQEMCESAVSRLPILVAGELDRCYYF